MADPKSSKKIYYDFQKPNFTEKDKNFLRYINDGSNDLYEFREFVIYHRDSFLDVIEKFKFLIKSAQTDDNSKGAMKQRITELTETIKTLNFVLDDIKVNHSSKNSVQKPE